MAERLADANLSNSAARADTIRAAVRWLAEHEAEVKALNAEIREYKQRVIKGDLGYKIADFNAVYRVSQLEAEDRDELLDCIREGFQALNIGQQLDWVAAARGEAQPHDEARRQGREDGLGSVRDHAARWPMGEYGHADYVLGVEEGTAERERALSMGRHTMPVENGAAGNGHDPEGDVVTMPAPRRRGRPPGSRNRAATQEEPPPEAA